MCSFAVLLSVFICSAPERVHLLCFLRVLRCILQAEEEMKRAQDERDKLEFELSVIVDEIGLVHHAMED